MVNANGNRPLYGHGPLLLQGWVFWNGMKQQMPAVVPITSASATQHAAVLWHGLTPTHSNSDYRSSCY